MKLTFQLRFPSRPGQSLWLTGNHPLLGDDRFEAALPLHYLDEQFWRGTVVIPTDPTQEVELVYHYWLRDTDGSVLRDWGNTRALRLSRLTAPEVVTMDTWNDPGSCQCAFYTEPFKAVLLRQNRADVRTPTPGRTTHIFNALAPLLEKDQTLCLLGNAPALAAWNIDHPVLLSRSPDRDVLTIELDLDAVRFPLTYKYGVYDLLQKKFLRYEDGPNRILPDAPRSGELTVLNDGFAALPCNTWKGAGVAIPLFSLRGERSFGIGEFTDLELLTDWCSLAGLKLIQLLPINDTTATHTWTDSYPYAAISAFALHPIYLNLGRVATARNRRLLENCEPERRRLNALETLDYEAVWRLKRTLLLQLYERQKARTLKSAAFKRFFQANEPWLQPYAVFCHLRDAFGTPDVRRWPKYRTYVVDEIRALAAEKSPVYDSVAFHFFVQYHLHEQLSAAVEYAHAKGVVLKGDIPIGVGRWGVDPWQHPDLFNLEMQAGAPPDHFAVKGQNWGFPTYNWDRMRQDGFRWWTQRFRQMGLYFDAFRIDHILGFFRIWSVPLDAVEGILGRFVPALPLRLAEFSDRRIPFDRRRLVLPYITDEVIQGRFGADHETVKARFLVSEKPGSYALKPEYSTQREVEDFFASLDPNEANARFKQGLFDLISNVILFEVNTPEEPQYHFRFGIEATSSFRRLDATAQARLKELYVDYFYRRQEQFWRDQALQRLPALKRATNMLICGEDLGMVPHCVPQVMRQLGLLSLEIQRMPKELGRQFFSPKDAAYLSVVTPSTHDMSTLRGWWTEDRAVTQRFYNEQLGLPGPAPERCEPWINQAIVVQHLASPAMWSIFQLQDLLGMDPQLRRQDAAAERINVPANPKNYWRYRMHLTLEQLVQATDFTGRLRALIRTHHR